MQFARGYDKGLRGPYDPAARASPLHLIPATGLGEKTSKLRLQLEKRKESFRAKEKAGEQPKNE